MTLDLLTRGLSVRYSDPDRTCGVLFTTSTFGHTCMGIFCEAMICVKLTLELTLPIPKD